MHEQRNQNKEENRGANARLVPAIRERPDNVAHAVDRIEVDPEPDPPDCARSPGANHKEIAREPEKCEAGISDQEPHEGIRWEHQ